MKKKALLILCMAFALVLSACGPMIDDRPGNRYGNRYRQAPSYYYYYGSDGYGAAIGTPPPPPPHKHKKHKKHKKHHHHHHDDDSAVAPMDQGR